MKDYLIMGVLVLFTQVAMAGESTLTTTYQPLAGLGSGGITIVPVTCHHWYSHSASSAVDLIAVKNVPPTDNPSQATDDLNLASVCGIRFSTSDLGAIGVPLEITLDLSKFMIPKRYAYPREEIVRSSLECLRRCLPKKLFKTPVTLKASNPDKKWMSMIVDEFNSHDRSKVFPTSPGRQPNQPKSTGEQGGARQPTTAPDSKSEGNEKPKPESEGRSQ